MVTTVNYDAQTVKYTPYGSSVLKNAIVGKKMTAHLDPGDPIKGSNPQLGGDDQGLYDALNNQYGPNEYIRGHLLNDNLGGLGVKDNLYPLTNAANHAHLEQAETVVKSLLVSDTTVDYVVNAVQDNPGSDFRKKPKSTFGFDVSVAGNSLISRTIPVEPKVGNWSLNDELDNKGFGKSGAGLASTRNKHEWLSTGHKLGYIRKSDNKILATTDQTSSW
jgi:hypothetical protein